MKSDEIKKLINKYYEGETSLEEEDLLRTFFLDENNKSVVPEFAQLMEMFGEYEQISFEQNIPNASRNKKKQRQADFLVLRCCCVYSIFNSRDFSGRKFFQFRC